MSKSRLRKRLSRRGARIYDLPGNLQPKKLDNEAQRSAATQTTKLHPFRPQPTVVQLRSSDSRVDQVVNMPAVRPRRKLRA
jgi:hypothetical protein